MRKKRNNIDVGRDNGSGGILCRVCSAEMVQLELEHLDASGKGVGGANLLQTSLDLTSMIFDSPVDVFGS